MKTRTLEKIKHIALVAHDNRKADLLDWVKENKATLAKHKLYATGTTGKLIEENLGQEVHCFMSGPLGGDQQIGAAIATKEINMLIFFWDPMEMQPHDSDVRALLRIGVTYNIPMASNRASADFLIHGPFMNEDYEAQIPDYSSYLNRKIPTKE